MASLNTLRTRGGIIVSIVIGLALIAFLLGDLTSAGGSLMNSSKMRVGEIGGNDISYHDFSERVDYFTNVEKLMRNSDALPSQEQERIKDVAWEDFISKYAYEEGFESLGLDVSEQEMIDMIDGFYISPVVLGSFVNPNTGVFDRNMLTGFVSNISNDETGRASFLWQYLKSQMKRQREVSKYITLVSAGMFANDLEVAQALLSSDNSADGQYVLADYSEIADSLVKVSAGEIKKYYNEHKRAFRQTASRDIEYVVFDVLPSPEDAEAAAKAVGEMADEFKASDNPMQYAFLNSQAAADNRYYKQGQLPSDLDAFAFGGSGMYGPVLRGDVYTMARIADTKMLPDSVGAMHILLPVGENKRADSLVSVIKGGADFARLAMQFSMDQNANQRGGDLGVFAPEQMVPEFSESILKNSVGAVYTVETQFGIHVVKITKKSAPVKKVQLAVLEYRVDPSNYTQQSIYAKASKFVSDVAGNYEGFKRVSNDEGLSKRISRLTPTERSVNGMENSRELIRWAFNGKQNDVSGIIEINGNYVVAALTDVKEDGFTALDQVSPFIEELLRTEKKADMLAAKMEGSTSLQEVASKFGTEVKSVSGVTFESFYLEGLGINPQFVGAFTSLPVGKLSKPVKGISGVAMFEVTAVSPVGDITPEGEKVRLESLSQNYLAERLGQAVVDMSNIKDTRVKFF